MTRLRRRAWMGVVCLLLSSCSGTSSRMESHDFADRIARAERADHTRLETLPCSPSAASNQPGDGATWTKAFATMQPTIWRSGDVGASTSLSDGRVLWVFGDTTRPASTHPRIVANSMLLTRARCFQEVRPAHDGPVIPSSDPDTACWPSSVLAVPMKGRDIVLVACSRIVRGGGGAGGDALYDFSYRGMSLALYSVRPNGAPVLIDSGTVVPDSPDQQQINWGSAMVGDGGWVYVYGSQQPRGSHGKAAYVARTRLSGISGTSRWQYWTGQDFSGNVNAARPVLPATQGVSQAFSVVAWRGSFLLVSKQGGEFGQNIGIWKASRPSGPWTAVKTVPQPYSLGGGVVAYQPLAHPEIPTNNGGLLVSMSRNTESVQDLYTDPRKGRPMFLDVSVP